MSFDFDPADTWPRGLFLPPLLNGDGSPYSFDPGATCEPSPDRKAGIKRRDAITSEDYYHLLRLPRHKKQQPRHYSRFRIYLVIAHYTGLRISAIGNLRRDEILNLAEGRQVDVNEHKKRLFRKVSLPERGQHEIRELAGDIDLVFLAQDTLSGTQHCRNWIRFINTCLIRALPDEGADFRSNSFRIAHITN